MNQIVTQSADDLISGFTQLIDHDLALELAYLRQENRILRSKLGKRVYLTDDDRHVLVQYGLPIKNRLKDTMSIVRPETLLNWHRKMKKKKWTYDTTPKKPGRPNKPEETEALVIKIAQENCSLGYTRISGELKKLGHVVSPSTVVNILRKHGMPSSPKRKGLSWKTFISSHMDVTWATDFFTEEVWTLKGLVTFYTLFFVHLGTRRVYIAGCTPHPNAIWMQQQARNFAMKLDDLSEVCKYLIHDRDPSFLPFDPIIKTENIKIIKTPPHTPMCNAYAERFVREARETLDNIIPLGRNHFCHVLRCIEKHHNFERPHQGIENQVPIDFEYPQETAAIKDIRCKSRLGGLLNHYYVDKAA
jgi:putative transposase